MGRRPAAVPRALLSHFLHPHLAGFEFTARIETDERWQLTRIERADVAPPYARAYCVDQSRPWLTQNEGAQLKRLLEAYEGAREALRETRVGAAVSSFAESHFTSKDGHEPRCS